MERRIEDGNERPQYLRTILEVILTGQPAGDAGPDDVAFILSGFISWLSHFPLVLRALGVPFYTINLTAENSLNDSVSVQNPDDKMLPRFIDKILQPHFEMAHITPPYSLKIHKEFFSWENNQSFADFLTSPYAEGLVGMSMSVPINGGSMNLRFENTLQFPAMRALSILFSDQGTEIVHGSNHRFVSFIQRILNGANQLAKLEFSYSQNNTIPTQLHRLVLPACLSSLYLKCELTAEQLQPLTVCNLPNLKNFGLFISTHILPPHLLYEILARFRRTLETLYFYGIEYDERSRPPEQYVSYFSFPRMESLKMVSSSSIHTELADGRVSLQVALPQLTHMCLKQQTRGMFGKWTLNSQFDDVTSLDVGLVNGNFSQERCRHHISLSVTEILRVQRVFPNLTVLSINVAEDVIGLVWLLRGTLPLEELKLVVKREVWHNDTEKWDTLLLGVSPDRIRTLMELPYLMNDPIYNPNFTSIRKFTALQCLTLSAPFLPDIDIEEQDSLISDAVFRLGFELMPSLNRLDLAGRFWATSRVTQDWRLLGRSINYTATVDTEEATDIF